MSDKVATTTTYFASGATIIGALTFNEWMMLGGFVVGLITAIYNIWFKERLLKIAREKNQISIKE